MICASIVALEAKDLISGVISLSAAGLGLCFAFLILKAPALAITQLVVEILCVIVLIRATIDRDLPLTRDGRWFFNTISTFLFIGFFLICAYFVLGELPQFGKPIMKAASAYIAFGSEEGGVDNIVTAVTLNFRSYDALAQAAVLFAALVAALAITRKVGRLREK